MYISQLEAYIISVSALATYTTVPLVVSLPVIQVKLGDLSYSDCERTSISFKLGLQACQWIATMKIMIVHQ